MLHGEPVAPWRETLKPLKAEHLVGYGCNQDVSEGRSELRWIWRTSIKGKLLDENMDEKELDEGRYLIK